MGASFIKSSHASVVTGARVSSADSSAATSDEEVPVSVDSIDDISSLSGTLSSLALDVVESLDWEVEEVCEGPGVVNGVLSVGVVDPDAFEPVEVSAVVEPAKVLDEPLSVVPGVPDEVEPSEVLDGSLLLDVVELDTAKGVDAPALEVEPAGPLGVFEPGGFPVALCPFDVVVSDPSGTAGESDVVDSEAFSAVVEVDESEAVTVVVKLAVSLAVVDPARAGPEGLGVVLVLLGVGTPLGPDWLFVAEGGEGVGGVDEISASVFD